MLREGATGEKVLSHHATTGRQAKQSGRATLAAVAG